MQLHAFLISPAEGEKWSASHFDHPVPGERAPATTGWNSGWSPDPGSMKLRKEN